MENIQEQKQDQGKENEKVLKAFNHTLQKLTAIVKGPENLKPTKKIPRSTIETLVDELFEEETVATKESVKEDLKGLLKAYVTLNNSLNEERKKLDNLEISKKKEFNIAANKLFNKIDGVDAIHKEYYQAFGAAVEATNVPKLPETEE